MTHSDSYSRVPGSKLLKAQTANKTQQLQQHRSICIFALATHRALCTCGSSPWVSRQFFDRGQQVLDGQGLLSASEDHRKSIQRSASNEPPSLSLHLWQHFRFQDESFISFICDILLFHNPACHPSASWPSARKSVMSKQKESQSSNGLGTTDPFTGSSHYSLSNGILNHFYSSGNPRFALPELEFRSQKHPLPAAQQRWHSTDGSRAATYHNSQAVTSNNPTWNKLEFNN